MRFNILLATAGAILVFASQQVSGQSLCDVVSNSSNYVGQVVRFDAVALSGPHSFDVSIMDERCADKLIRLASGTLQPRTTYEALLARLYPGYPEDGSLSDTKVRVHVHGTFVIREEHGAGARLLFLNDISILEPQ